MNRRRGTGWVLTLCASLLLFSGAAGAATGVVRLTGSVTSGIAIGPSGTAHLVATLRNGNKKEWFYVYAVEVPAQPQGAISVKSNRAWAGSFVASQTVSSKKMGLADGVLRVSSTLPSSFAQANAAPVVRGAPISLGASNPAGIVTIRHFFLLQTTHKSGPFAATITYSVGQVVGAATATSQTSISYPGA